MYVVDASVWVSRFVSGDVHHEPSRLWFARLVEEETALTNTGAAVPGGTGTVVAVLGARN